MRDEIWETLDEFTDYQVSNTGEVRKVVFRKSGVRDLHPIQWAFDQAGYPIVRLCNRGQYHTKHVHRLVAEQFIPKPDWAGIQVNHKNGVKHDPRVENLEWVTASENCFHAYRTGLRTDIGENHPKAKMTVKKVRDMRKLFSDGIYILHYPPMLRPKIRF